MPILPAWRPLRDPTQRNFPDRKSTRLNSSHGYISYAVFCLKKKINQVLSSLNNKTQIFTSKLATNNVTDIVRREVLQTTAAHWNGILHHAMLSCGCASADRQ